jgi:hypothetical protein
MRFARLVLLLVGVYFAVRLFGAALDWLQGAAAAVWRAVLVTLQGLAFVVSAILVAGLSVWLVHRVVDALRGQASRGTPTVLLGGNPGVSRASGSGGGFAAAPTVRKVSSSTLPSSDHPDRPVDDDEPSPSEAPLMSTLLRRDVVTGRTAWRSPAETDFSPGATSAVPGIPQPWRSEKAQMDAAAAAGGPGSPTPAADGEPWMSGPFTGVASLADRTVTAPDDATDMRPPRTRIAIIDSHGVQVGHGNRQINVYHYSVEGVSVDLSSVTTRTCVLAAVARYAKDRTPGNRDAAVQALGGSWWQFDGRAVVDPSQWKVHFARPRGGHEDLTIDQLDGTIVIDSCSGVQIGDYNRQRNDFEYKVFHPDVNVERLLASVDFAGAVLDTMVDGPSLRTEHLMGDRLDDLIVEARLPEIPTSGEHDDLIFTGYDGISVGTGVRRTDRSTVTVEGPASVSGFELSL